MFIYTTERELQDHIIENFSLFFDFRYVDKEHRLEDGSEVDIIGEDDKSIYLIELKRSSGDGESVRQVRHYVDIFNPSSKSIVGIVAAPEIKKSAILELKSNEKIRLMELKNVKCKLDSGLKNRSRFGVAIDNELLANLKNLSSKTRIPSSKLLDEAIGDLIKKYGSEIDGEH